MVDAEVGNQSGVVEVFTGVPLLDLVYLLQPAEDATTLVLVGADGYSAEIPFGVLEACPTCVVAMQDGGSLRSAMPGLGDQAQVKDLVELVIR